MIKPLPIGIKLVENDTSLTIERKWFSFSHIFILIFCAFWDGVIIFFYTIGLSSFTKDIEGNFNSAMIPFLLLPLGHVSVGIGLTYYAISGLLNKTIVKAESGLLTVRHLPIPWPGNRSIQTSNIKQLYCVEKSRRTRSGHYLIHNVNAVLMDNKEICLVKNLSEHNQAAFIEEKIEKYLNIKDEEVMGEKQKK